MDSGLLNSQTTRNNGPIFPRKKNSSLQEYVSACTLSNTLAIYVFPAFTLLRLFHLDFRAWCVPAQRRVHGSAQSCKRTRTGRPVRR